MLLLRMILVAMFAIVLLYTGFAVQADGLNLMEHFAGDIFKIGWPGQFNLDFLCYLILSAIWIVWRHQFGVYGYVLACFALVGGILFLAPYLVITISRSNGNIEELLTGKGR